MFNNLKSLASSWYQKPGQQPQDRETAKQVEQPKVELFNEDDDPFSKAA